MAGTGTGYPYTFRCAKCKSGMLLYSGDGSSGTRVVATGRTRQLTSGQFGHGHPRALYYRAEYRCEDCGHVGWSRHRRMERLLKAGGYETP